jgi:hypothetical protein
VLGSPGACRVVRESLTAEVDLGRRTLTRTRLPCARLSPCSVAEARTPQRCLIRTCSGALILPSPSVLRRARRSNKRCRGGASRGSQKPRSLNHVRSPYCQERLGPVGAGGVIVGPRSPQRDGRAGGGVEGFHA